ncbi:MAG: heavy metal translocating P-type ATPase [Candidatus Thorarchaeota archaeon]
MSTSSQSACVTCAAEQARKEDVDLTTKYALALVSATTLALGLILEFSGVNMIYVYIPYLVSLISAGRWIIPNGIRSILKIHLGISFLMTSAAIGAMLIGAPAEGASVMFLFFIAELLEEKAGVRVRSEMQSLLELETVSINVRSAEGETCMGPDQVSLGEIILVRPGERIGLDGVITLGDSNVDQSPITGESLPVEKSEGDEVYAGTINQEGYLEIMVTKTSDNTVLSRIINLVEQAQENKAPTERFVARFSHYYTPLVVLSSLLLAVFSFLYGLPILESIYRGLSLLVISCPCAFAISIPVSMVSALTGAARNGVLVKGSEYIENLSNVQTVALDKTGTLTKGNLSVVDVCVHNGSTRQIVLKSAVSLEKMSEHPIAEAILVAAEEEGIQPWEADEFLAIPGKGVTGTMNGKTYIVGNRRLMSERTDVTDTDLHNCGTGTMVYVVEEDVHLGTVVLSDTARDESRTAIDSLKSRGIRTVMLTGDSKEVAEIVANQLAIDEYHAELLPHEKVEIVERLSETNPVAMVGDGINDAPAIAAADVGIAMGVISSDAALETADVALMDDDLSKLPELFHLAKRTMKVVKEGVAVSIFVKALLGVLAIFGLITLWIAVGIGDMGLTLAVIANALRLTRKSKNGKSSS